MSVQAAARGAPIGTPATVPGIDDHRGAATFVGFITVFQVVANGGPLSPRGWEMLVISLALGGSLVLTLVDGPLLHRLDLPVAETWGILALQLMGSRRSRG